MITIINKHISFPVASILKMDMHSHILPGIDDGAATVADSLTLIDGLIEMGYEQLIATPHIMCDLYPNTPSTIHAAYEKLMKAMTEKGYRIPVAYAAEYLIDEEFKDKVEEGLLTLGDKYVLVETMFSMLPPNIEDTLFFLKTHQYKPVLAHPERYHYVDNKFKHLEVFQKHECFFQPNILSFSGYYGDREKDLAQRLLEAGLIDFLGTDIHHTRHLKMLKHLKVRSKIATKLEEIVFKNSQLTCQTMAKPPVGYVE